MVRSVDMCVSWATVRHHHHQIAYVLKWLVLVFFAYPVTAPAVAMFGAGVAMFVL